MTEQDIRPNMALPVLVQREPAPGGRVGPWQLAAASVAAVAIVVMVLYGVSRPTEPPQVTAASEQAAPAAQQGKARPSTTGAAPSDQGHQRHQAPAASEKRSDSATDKAPGDKSPAKK